LNSFVEFLLGELNTTATKVKVQQDNKATSDPHTSNMTMNALVGSQPHGRPALGQPLGKAHRYQFYAVDVTPMRIIWQYYFLSNGWLPSIYHSPPLDGVGGGG
jgi:hypothetical protein